MVLKMNKPNLIVIDDDIQMAQSTAEITSLIGFESSITDSVDHFIESIENKFYDVIISDVFMPDKDGIELINELSDKEIKSSLVFMSGYDENILETVEHFAKFKGLNIIGTLSKPFKFNEIKLILDNF